MDKYKKGLLAFLPVAILSLFFSIFIFTLDSEEESTVLGVQEEKVAAKENPMKEFVFNEKVVKYDENIFQIEEDENSTILLPKNWQTFQYAVIDEFEDVEALESILRDEKGYLDLERISTQANDNYYVYLYTYNQPYFLKEGSESKFLTLYLAEVDTDEKYYIEARSFNYEKDSITNDAFVDIVKSLKGIEVSEDDVLGVTNDQINLGKILGQSATLKVFARNCYDLKFSNELEGFTIAGRDFKVCSAGTGSGFLINGSGEIMTNAHVVRPHGFDSIANGVSPDGTYEEAMAKDLIDILYLFLGDFVYLLSQNQIETFYLYVLDEMYQEDLVTVTLNENEVYVGFDNNFEINIGQQDLEDKSLHQSATLVKANDIPSFYQIILSNLDEEDFMDESLGDMMGTDAVKEGITGVADLALIKMDTIKNRPSLQVRLENPMAGEQIHVVGYPAINEDQMMISTTELLGSTITSGSITGIKPNTTNSYNLLQIDASIESGNSGGPIIDNEAKVLGMTTYSYASNSGNFNWGISGEEIRQFITQAGSRSEENENALVLSSAITDISKDYYSRSKGKLEELVSKESSLSSILTPVIEVCNTNIEQGNDKSPWIDLGFIDIPNWGLLLIGGVLVVIVVVVIILLAVLSKSKKKKRKDEIEEVFTNPQEQFNKFQPTQPTQQPPQNQVQQDDGSLMPKQPTQQSTVVENTPPNPLPTQQQPPAQQAPQQQNNTPPTPQQNNTQPVNNPSPQTVPPATNF